MAGAEQLLMQERVETGPDFLATVGGVGLVSTLEVGISVTHDPQATENDSELSPALRRVMNAVGNQMVAPDRRDLNGKTVAFNSN